MLVTEQLTINGTLFTKNYSDSGYYIERDGERYSEAIDPAAFGRTYTETDVPIETEAELTVADALELLGEMGVNTDD